MEVDVLLATNDATVWAGEFKTIADRLYGTDMDEGWLIGWFANAMEAERRNGVR